MLKLLKMVLDKEVFQHGSIFFGTSVLFDRRTLALMIIKYLFTYTGEAINEIVKNKTATI